ncbi:MAG: hypothetical protein ACFFC7_33215 [Candidatus Hermodarchaeota archaeon]
MTRRKCFYNVLRLAQQVDIEGNLANLVRIIAQTLVILEGKYYRRALSDKSYGQLADIITN